MHFVQNGALFFVEQDIRNRGHTRLATQYDQRVSGFAVENNRSEARKNIQLEIIKELLVGELYNKHVKFCHFFEHWGIMGQSPTMILTVTMLINYFLRAYLRSQHSFREATTILPQIFQSLFDVQFGAMAICLGRPSSNTRC